MLDTTPITTAITRLITNGTIKRFRYDDATRLANRHDEGKVRDHVRDAHQHPVPWAWGAGI